MATVLYLAHRLPYPPDKGDKVRTHHLLRHLHESHRVLLGTFVDDPADLRHVPAVSNWCAEAHVVRLLPAWARVRALRGLLRGEPLSLGYYRDRDMSRWVRRVLRSAEVDAVVVSSSAMAGYAEGFDVPVLMDFIDVDSLKWSAYAARRKGFMAWLYRREGRRLLEHERRTARAATCSFFVTQREVDLFARLAPDCAAGLQVVRNGVDAVYYSASPGCVSPYGADELPIVFTGTMNYPPNVEAVAWFAAEVLPALSARWPALRLSVVGRHPAPEVMALASRGVRVTGTVPDTRPWVQHAAVVVAPMRLARGVQNKVLEAMAMGRPVVAARECAQALELVDGAQLIAASTAEEYVRAIGELLSEPERAARLGASARRHVVECFDWARCLQPIDRCLEAAA